jgi:hypothetical protein
MQKSLSSTAAPVSNAHTYRLLIVKELVRYYLLHGDKAFCLSAARKEYKLFSSFRQPVFLKPIFLQPDITATFLCKFAASCCFA